MVVGGAGVLAHPEKLPVVAEVFKRQLAQFRLPVELHYVGFAGPEHTEIVFDQVKA